MLFFIKIYTQDEGYLNHFLVTERDRMYTDASDCTTENESYNYIYYEQQSDISSHISHVEDPSLPWQVAKIPKCRFCKAKFI